MQPPNELAFNSNGYDAAICLNGALPARTVFEQIVHLPFIAADGAADALLAMNIVPGYIVGDLDSVQAQTLRAARGIAEIISDGSQDTNDFEKSLVFAERMQWQRLLVVGMHGGDLEHTLNNWSVLMRFGRRMQLCAFDAGRYAIPAYHSFGFTAAEGEVLSLIPQPLVRLSTTGLQWELTNEELSLGTREGARNVARTPKVDVNIHAGSLLFFCDSRFPASPSMR